MRSFAALSLLAVAGLSTAQEQYNIDPESVTQSLRGQSHAFHSPGACTANMVQNTGANNKSHNALSSASSSPASRHKTQLPMTANGYDPRHLLAGWPASQLILQPY